MVTSHLTVACQNQDIDPGMILLNSRQTLLSFYMLQMCVYICVVLCNFMQCTISRSHSHKEDTELFHHYTEFLHASIPPASLSFHIPMVSIMTPHFLGFLLPCGLSSLNIYVSHRCPLSSLPLYSTSGLLRQEWPPLGVRLLKQIHSIYTWHSLCLKHS